MSQAADEHVIVETSAGAVRGRRRGGSDVFRGIPYAEPPYGERRFLAPQPRAPWPGVRDASQFGPTPQRRASGPVTAIPEPSIPGEDVLSVNVWTPASATAAGSHRPVLFWVHGGGYSFGSPASPWYDGAAFNRDGVVLVTMSYRLGFEGFGWLPDAPVNRGVLDWLLALEWVRDNIAAFGGDPAQVTLAGQSAGGGAVMTLLLVPRARGLFARAVAFSGAPADIPLAAAKRTTARLAERLDVALQRDRFAAVPERDLLEAVSTGPGPSERSSVESLLALVGSGEGMLGFGPVLDGDLLERGVIDGVRAGAAADVPLLVGSTRDEFAGLVSPYRELFEGSDALALLRRVGVEEHLARRYLDTLAGRHPADVLGRYVTDRTFRRYVPVWAKDRRSGGQTWVYDFAWRGASGLAEHCLDVPFVFDVLGKEHVARIAGPDAPQTLADEMHGAVAAFAHGRSPGWGPYDRVEAAMVFDQPSRLEAGTYESAEVLLQSTEG